MQLSMTVQSSITKFARVEVAIKIADMKSQDIPGLGIVREKSINLLSFLSFVN